MASDVRALKAQSFLPAAAAVAILLVACGEGATEPEISNRAPLVVTELPTQVLAADGSAKLDASAYFSDPDGDALTYSAVADDSSFVRVYISGAEVSLFGKNRGNPWVSATRITVTATDPDGLFAEQQLSVTVEAGDVGFRDEFDSPPLSTWHLTNASAEVDSGTLRLTSSSSGPGKAKRPLDAGMIDWEVRTRLARVQDSTTVRIVASTGSSPIQAFALDIGPGILVDGNATNYRMLFQHTGQWNVMVAGNYAAFDKAENVLEVGFFLKDGRIGFAVNGITIRTESDVDFAVAGVELWVDPMGGAADGQALFDWVEVAGTVN